MLEKQWRFEFSKLSRKVVWLLRQHTWGLISGTDLSRMENTQKEKSQNGNSNLQAVLKICCDFGDGAQSVPGAWIGLKYTLTWFYSLTPLKVHFLQGFQVWHLLKYIFTWFYSWTLLKIYVHMVSHSDTTHRYFCLGFTVWHHLKSTAFSWFFSLTPLKVYFSHVFTLWNPFKYTFYTVLQSEITSSFYMVLQSDTT